MSWKNYSSNLKNLKMKGISDMNGLKNKLLEEQNRLEEMIKFQKEQLKNVPEGSLRLSKSHGKFQFYLLQPGEPCYFLFCNAFVTRSLVLLK